MGYATSFAVRLGGLADISAVQDKPVMGSRTVFFRYLGLKILLNVKRCLALRKPHTVSHPEHMGINGNHRGVVAD